MSSRAVITKVRTAAPALPVRLPGRRAVPAGAEFDTEKPEPGAAARPSLRRSLAHAAGEHQDVERAQRGGHGRDARPQPMGIDVEREARLGITGAGAF